MTEAWGFAESAAEVEQLRDKAATIIGEQIVGVVYYEIDYRRNELRPDHNGLHWITDSNEWKNPSWMTPLCDSLDYGIELRTKSDRIFSITWEPPGRREGIGIQETRIIGPVLQPTADVAAWQVADRSRWTQVLDSPVTSIDLHFASWDPNTDQQSCSRITLTCGNSTVVMTLGEGNQEGEIKPSADNIAVLFDPVHLPEWA